MKKTTLLFLTLFLVSIGCFSDTGTIKKEIAVASPAIKLEKPNVITKEIVKQVTHYTNLWQTSERQYIKY